MNCFIIPQNTFLAMSARELIANNWISLEKRYLYKHSFRKYVGPFESKEVRNQVSKKTLNQPNSEEGEQERKHLDKHLVKQAKETELPSFVDNSDLLLTPSEAEKNLFST